MTKEDGFTAERMTHGTCSRIEWRTRRSHVVTVVVTSRDALMNCATEQADDAIACHVRKQGLDSGQCVSDQAIKVCGRSVCVFLAIRAPR